MCRTSVSTGCVVILPPLEHPPTNPSAGASVSPANRSAGHERRGHGCPTPSSPPVRNPRPDSSGTATGAFDYPIQRVPEASEGHPPPDLLGAQSVFA